MIWKWRFGSGDPPISTPAAGSAPVRFQFEDDSLVILTSALSGIKSNAAASAMLEQLSDEGIAEPFDAGYKLPWQKFYILFEGQLAPDELALLKLPPVTTAVPKLVSRGSLADATFVVAIDNWRLSDGAELRDARLCGGALEHGGQVFLLRPEVWRLVHRVREFAQRDDADRTDMAQRRAWGEIRRLAVDSGALLDDFLVRTVVLTPETLDLGLRRDADLGLVEVQPGFEGAPSTWLEAFDRSSVVRERYDFSTPEGVVQVVVSPEVATILREIKRMPGRRIAGERAEAFLLNPIAALGPDAAAVINEERFDQAKVVAGIVFERFSAITPETNGAGALGILVLSGSGDTFETHELRLDPDQVREFTDKVFRHIERRLQLCAWGEYEFELDGDSALHCEALLRALDGASPQVITHGRVFDLSGYSERIEGIGREKAFYAPYIAKKNEDDGWFPDNLVPLIGWDDPATGETQVLPLTDDLKRELADALASAKKAGRQEIALSGCPTPMPVANAEQLVATFKQAEREAGQGKFAPKKPLGSGKKPTLILKANIDHVDYREERLAALAAKATDPRLPTSLRGNVQLKPHQREGLAWMQHLLSLAPNRCRGALLADDMGLGKTLQTLCLIARAREENPAMPPALVVAPLSLLENWREEAEKFLEPGALRILTAYGENLARLRVGRSGIDEQLRKEGLVRFLQPDWRGDADLVLTTYETLRDLEFSFARERWSIMVCDEAQKIKNPNAAMTRAAKKQQALFRIACTGTPVENSLVDLWCLFDFVQPGLLGALNEFASTYRRPIEAKEDDDRQKVEELRRIIVPQLLRRMKSEVAADLKDKIVDNGSRCLPMSQWQRSLYVASIEAFRTKPNKAANGGVLALLHKLRLLCSDPRTDNTLDTFDTVELTRDRSPKLDWLLTTLARIRDREEKVIIFCEFKAIQRLIRHFVREAFDIPVDIINGDTSAAADAADNRQKRIRAFQEWPGFGVIILSPVAVGFGVNMQAANHVIHFTRTWNPAKEDQATDRAYRIGQTKDVFVYYPSVSAKDFKTFDVKLDELLERKRMLATDMLNGAGDISADEFDVDALQTLPD